MIVFHYINVRSLSGLIIVITNLVGDILLGLELQVATNTLNALCVLTLHITS